jgi:hypothetical protein
MKYLLLFLILLLENNLFMAQDYLYAVAKGPTPVLNTNDFKSVFGGADGMTVKTDNQGLIREMEYIALPGTVFDLIGEYDYGTYKIFKVETKEYEYNTNLYVDSRFLDLKKQRPPERKINLPSKGEIYDFLDKVTGNRYCWGGNFNNGISRLIELYQPSGNISSQLKNEWMLTGCDCSGLMFEATNGYTPRNTSKLVNYGNAVEIEGLSAEEIAAKLMPLDMMVWNGHVIYVYDENTAIQSSLSKGGVVKTDLITTIKDLMGSRTPVNNYDSSAGERFVIRRWFGN